jgi:hypothetical protein
MAKMSTNCAAAHSLLMARNNARGEVFLCLKEHQTLMIGSAIAPQPLAIV